MIDSNRDGFITQQELKTALDMMGEHVTNEELTFVFNIIDANKDGKLSNSEVYNFAKTQGMSLYSRAEKTNILFRVYDSNKDGYLN
jgi:hypothetical protein